MAMPKRNLNAVYISERLRESLRPISHCALTTVVAPMGYGKTTAVNWYLSQRASEAARIIRVSVYSDNLAIFWQSVQSAFCHGGLSFLSGYPCPADAAGGSPSRGCRNEVALRRQIEVVQGCGDAKVVRLCLTLRSRNFL